MFFTNTNDVIPSNQIGFPKGSRTSDHVLVLKTLINKYTNGSQLAKMKEYSWHVPAIKFIGMKQLV